MNRPNGQQCLAKTIIDRPVCDGSTQIVIAHIIINRQYAILRLAQFTEPLPDNDEVLVVEKS